jgi:hypothetical protein
MDGRRPYGFCNDLELAAVKVLDSAGLAAFERDVRAHFDEECAALSERKRLAEPNPNHARDRWARMLKARLFAATQCSEVH